MTNTERIVTVLRESGRPLTTSEVARAAQLWDHEASGALTHLKRTGRIRVAEKVKCEKSHQTMNLWAMVEGDARDAQAISGRTRS